MGVISLKDYAKQHDITYEAVRQQVARYREQLGDHIVIDGRQQFLDEDAVTFLDTKREKNPVVIQNDDIKAELDETKAALERLKFEYAKKEGQVDLLKQQLTANFGAAERLEAAEQRVADLERRAIEARQREVETSVALEKAEAKVEEAKKVTQALIEQADKAKADAKASEDMAAELKAKLEKLQSRNLWQRIFNKE